MKKLILFTTLCFGIHFLQAQYCGNSGPSQCTPTGGFVTPGFYPAPSQLPPFINGQPSTTTLEFKNFNIINFAGNNYLVNWLRIDTVSNLPPGLCWASNDTANTYLNQQDGCIRLTGTPNGIPGEYKIRIIVTANVAVGPTSQTLQVNADVSGVIYQVRLIDSCQTAPPTDTLQTVEFVPYNIPGCFYVNLGADVHACNGSIITLNPSTLSGRPPFTYSWQSTGNTVSCDTCANPTVTLTQNSTFFLTATDSFGVVAKDTISYFPLGAAFDFSIAAAGADTFCIGGSVTLHAHESSTRTYQWQLNGNDISGATDSTYVASDSTGIYNVFFADTGGCTASSNNIAVVINPLPNVSFVLNPDVVCLNASPFAITGANPVGGNFSGIGVSGSIFNPATAGTGPHVLIYTYMDLNGCTNTDRDTITVNVCTGIEEADAKQMIHLYPNPVNTLLTITSDLFSNNQIVPIVLDVTGKSIPFSYTKESNQIVLDVSSIPAGVYVVKLDADGKQFNSHFVKVF